MDLQRESRFLSYVLRHKPEDIGLALDREGWADVGVLLTQCRAHGHHLGMQDLVEIVVRDTKGRYVFNQHRTRIRAAQGHSVKIDLGHKPVEPPAKLYHGTATRFLDSIRQQGLLCMKRQHVHLSADHNTAVAVGQRHGKPVVLTVLAQEMHRAGHQFYLADNGVWLTGSVPTRYIDFGATTF